MKNTTIFNLCLLAVFCSLALFGCGSGADEDKPMSEVKAEAEKMDTAKLKSVAKEYKANITAKTAEISELVNKLKDVPVTEKLGDEAKGIMADIEAVNKSVSSLTERFQVYYDKLKEKGGDLSGLEL